MPFIEELYTDELDDIIKSSNHLTDFDKNDKMFSDYNKAQARNRQANAELVEYTMLKETLGETFVYKSLGGFRRAKRYYDLKYPDTPNKMKAFEMRAKIKSNVYPKALRRDKQLTHFKGSKDFKPTNSYLVISLEEIQEIVDKNAGEGAIFFGKTGKITSKELVICDKTIGYCYNINGELVETDRMWIHYSKKGTHVVPTLYGKEMKNGNSKTDV